MIEITHCGHNSRHLKPFEIEHKNGLPNYLFLFVKTPARFKLGDSFHTTASNMMILFDKMTPIHYGSLNSAYNDDWIHFDFVDEQPFSDMQIPFHTPLYLPQSAAIAAYIPLLVQAFHTIDRHSAENRDMLMRLILFQIDSQLNCSQEALVNHKYYSILSQIRTEMRNAPQEDWSVEAMAALIPISPSYFQALYKDFFGVPCMQDVIKARIDNAKYYLKNTDLPVHLLAGLCGYVSESHFQRQFKKLTGITPARFRKL